jgi:restriction endonuclease S subunit
LEGRLDPFCYIPELVELDRLIQGKTEYRLKDFAKSHAGGATPHKDDADRHYTTKENGFPFLRVQNLSATGELNFNNLIYITQETHHGLLRRSRVYGGDLLVKITGVGRMAVASVAPAGFEGNINQHIVVVRTGSPELSRQLAAFLNLDSVERIASKRATGATRPALDYPALFSLPVIASPEIAEKINIAIEVKNNKEAEAQVLLDSIDDYLLAELGIHLPKEEEKTILSRVFIEKISTLSGGRLDAELSYYSRFIVESKYLALPLSKLLIGNPQYGANEAGIDRIDAQTPRYIRITDIDSDGNLIKGMGVTVNTVEEKYILEDNDLLIARSGNTVGKSYLHKSGSVDIPCIYAGYMIRFRIDEKLALPDYIFFYLQSAPYKAWVKAIQRVTGQPNINAKEYGSLKIPLPPLEKQQAIAARISDIREKAKQLQAEAATGLEKAKAEVEKMILGVEQGGG